MDRIRQLRVKRRMEENLAFYKGKEVPPPPPHLIKKYEDWKASRKVTRLEDMRESEQQAILAAIAQYTKEFPDVQQIYLTGSFASGSWIREDSTDRDREIRFIKKRLKEKSDIDLVSYPVFSHRSYGNVEFTPKPKGRRVKIWDRIEQK